MHRLAYSFGWDGSEVVPPGSSLVEIDLTEEPPDGTLLRLTPPASLPPSNAPGMQRLGPLSRLAGRGCCRARPGPGSLARPRWWRLIAFPLSISRGLRGLLKRVPPFFS